MAGSKEKKTRDPGTKPRRRKWRRWVALLLLLLIGLIGGGSSAIWLLSRSYRIRGIERWIEARIRESTSLDVQIGEIVSHPLSELVATEIRTLAISGGAAPGAFEFTCPRASLLYDPLRLVSGEIREIRIDGLRAHIDLDRLEKLPFRGDAGSGIRVLSIAVEAPQATIIAGGRAYDLEDLRVRFGSLRGDPAQPVEVSARYAGATIQVWGTIENVPEGVRVGQAHFQVEQADLSRLLDKIPLALAARGSGRARIDGSARGIWPKRVTWQIETRLDDVDLSSDSIGAGVRSGTVDLALSGAIDGPFDAVDVACTAEGHLRWGAPLSEMPEAWTMAWSGRYASAVATGGEAVWRLDRARLDSRDLGTIEIAGQVRDPFGRPRVDLSLDAHAAALSLFARRIDALRPIGLDGMLRPILGQTGMDFAGLAGRASIRARLLGEASDPHGSIELSLDQAGLRAGGIEFAGTRAELRIEGTPENFAWSGEGTLGELAIAGSGRWKDVAFTGCGRSAGEGGEIALEELKLVAPELPSVWLRGVVSRAGYRDIELSAGPARLEGFRHLIASLGVAAPAIPDGLDGLLETAITLRHGAWNAAEHSFRAEIRLADGAYVAGSGPDGVSGIRAAFRAEGMASAAEVCMRITCEPRAREILAGRFFRDVSKDPFAATATIEVGLRPLRIHVPSAILELPGAGTVRLQESSNGLETRIRCEVPDGDAAAILAIARDGFWESPPALRALDIAGRLSCDIEYIRREGRDAFSGEIALRAGSGPIASVGDAAVARESAHLAYGPL
ncbi:MAG: hypothetical protein JXP34_13895, partial [Planctomycetes bacterium]|nr:hypothetical protein [Planctomycetota bacterium]